LLVSTVLDDRPVDRPATGYAAIKRGLDACGAAVLLVLTTPSLLLLALLVRLVMGRPVLFRQKRPGLHGHPFTILKFRTMREDALHDGVRLPDDQRLTAAGRFMRRWSLDELPELWNVLRGDMSLVGPRPLLMEYLPLYTPEQARRHEVRPGLTGLAQVRGRNALTWEEKFALDVWYVDHVSPLLDLRILALTVGQVLSGRAISHAGHATMPRFGGSLAANRESADA
jgi:lipopolysaccharide/colanic/teichoic acid biosynthesis glycosyltransferase